MDPDKTLEELRTLAKKQAMSIEQMTAFVERFENLDAWLSGGGYVPEAWNKSFRRIEK